MKYRAFIIGCMALLSQASWSQEATDDAYAKCTGMVATAPLEALRTANRALAQQETTWARHCRALALFGLQKYRESALELQRLGATVTPAQTDTWLHVMQQSATAYEQAGDGNSAHNVLLQILHDGADNLTPANMTAVLLQDAKLLQKMNRPYDALQALDHAASLAPNDAAVRAARAGILKQIAAKGH